MLTFVLSGAEVRAALVVLTLVALTHLWIWWIKR